MTKKKKIKGDSFLIRFRWYVHTECIERILLDEKSMTTSDTKMHRSDFIAGMQLR